MPQYLADLGQRRSAAQHLGRQRVAKLMGARRRCADVRAQEGMSHERPNGARAPKAADGRTGPQEHATAGAARSSVPQIGGDRLTDIRGQGERGALTAFP